MNIAVDEKADNLPARIKSARERRGWTQEQLASRSDLTAAAIDQMERGLRTPSAETLRRIALALQTSTDGLLGLESQDAVHPRVLRLKEFLGEQSGQSGNVHCPVCGDWKIHFGLIEVQAYGRMSRHKGDMVQVASPQLSDDLVSIGMWCDGRYEGGTHVFELRFVIDGTGAHFEVHQWDWRSEADAPCAPTPLGFRPGDRVRHAHFGEGIATRIDGEGDEAQISVVFPVHGTKKLVAGYAALEKI